MMINLFQKKQSKIHSGIDSDFKIECNALTDKDFETLAYLINKKRKFKKVIGIPPGGLRLAEALKKYCDVQSNTLLIVDDVLTAGISMEAEYANNKEDFIEGIVIFARGKCPEWVTPIFQMNI